MDIWRKLKEYFETIAKRDDPEWKQLGEMHVKLINQIQEHKKLKNLNCAAIGLNIDIEGKNSIVRLYWKYNQGFLISASQFREDDAVLVPPDAALSSLVELLL